MAKSTFTFFLCAFLLVQFVDQSWSLPSGHKRIVRQDQVAFPEDQGAPEGEVDVDNRFSLGWIFGQGGQQNNNNQGRPNNGRPNNPNFNNGRPNNGQNFPNNNGQNRPGQNGNQQFPGNGQNGNQQFPGNGQNGNQQFPGNGQNGNQQFPGNGQNGNQQFPGNGQNGNQQGQGNGQNRPGQNQQQQQSTPAAPTTAAPVISPECVQRCAKTPEYNPVCATNRQQFNNRSVLECNRRCGLNAQYLRDGACRPAAPETEE